MSRATLALGLAGLLAGCAVVEETPRPTWKVHVVDGWKLTQRPYGELAESWALAEDGLVAPGAPALYFEPVFRDTAPLAVGDEPGQAHGFERCYHALRLRYEGHPLQGVGSWVETRLEIPGPSGVAHAIEIAGSYAGVEIREVRGARPLAGASGRYVIPAGRAAIVRFTSRLAGRGGLEARVLGELGDVVPSPSPLHQENEFVNVGR